MAKELAKIEQTPMELAFSLAQDGKVEASQLPAMMRELLTLDREYKADRAREAFAKAVAKFQAACPPVHKGKAASFGGRDAYRYAAYEDILQVITPHLRDAGLSVRFDTQMLDGRMLRCTCYIQHGTHAEPSSVTLPMPENMKVNDTQKAGAALTYARRYALCAALNIVVTGEDTDANYEAAPAKPAPVGMTQEQIDTLSDLLAQAEQVGANRAGFLGIYKVKAVSDILPALYQDAYDRLCKRVAEGGK